MVSWLILEQFCFLMLR